MQFDKTGRTFLLANRVSAKKFLKSYEKEFISLNRSLADFPGLKADIDLGYDENDLDLVRFAALTNDIFTFATRPGQKMVMNFYPEPDKRKDIFGEKFEISVELERVKHLVGKNGTLPGFPAFVHAYHPQSNNVINTIAPLMMRGRALLRPHRTLLVQNPKPVGRQKWEMLSIDETSPFDHWSGEATPTDNITLPVRSTSAGSGSDEVKLFDIVIPFLSGIGFHDLAKILEDEELHLAKARMAMKKVLIEANAEGFTANQVVNEVLRPELDVLERRFQALTRSKIFKQGAAAVGAATLSLVAFSTGGLVAGLSSAAGASGLGVLARDWLSDKDKAEAYADSPHYLFWRLRRLQK